MKKFKGLDRYTKLSIIIILIGITIRFYLAAIHHISGDACWQISNSRFIAENLKIPLFEQFGRDEPFWAPPLFHIVSAFIYFIFAIFSKSSAEFAVKMISPILGSLTLILFYFISKMLFNKKTVFYSLIFLTFIPLHMDYSVFSYIDGMLTFLIVLSVYFALKNKIISLAIAAGLAILTKYNGIFILPVLLYIIYLNNKNNKSLLNKLLITLIIPVAIGSIWFIRNWVYLGNPIWPFMNNMFHGVEVSSFAESAVGSVNMLNILNIVSINAITPIYLGIFGVPDGNIKTLDFFQIPYVNILFAVWLLGTIIFLIPLVIGLLSKRLKYRNLLLIWIGSYVILVILYVINASWSATRFMLPSFPAIALIWGGGLEIIKPSRIKNVLVVLIALIITGFVFAEFLKISLAAKAWDFYNDDFEWAKSNTNKNAIFLSGSQCISYNIDRQTASPEIKSLRMADYIWINQNFKLDKRSILSEEILKSIQFKDYTAVYFNNATGTTIYHAKYHAKR